MENIYMIQYRYTDNSSYRYKTFDKLVDATDYYLFLKNNLDLSYLILKKCSIVNEVWICGN